MDCKPVINQNIDKLNKAIVDRKNAANLALSPFCIKIMLNAIFAGAVGESSDELRNLMNICSTESMDVTLDRFFKEQNVIKTMMNETKSSTVNFHQIMLYREIVPIKGDYIKVLTKLGFEIMRCKESDQELASRINQWVRQASNGKIKKLEIAEDLAKDEIIFINALYFKAYWKLKFPVENTKKLPFYKSDGSSTMVATMTRKPFACLGSTENEWVIRLPFETLSLATIIVLPKSGNDVDSLVVNTGSNSPIFYNCLSKAELFLPKFRINSVIDLKSPLTDVGVKRIFVPDNALLHSISDDHRLFVNHIGQAVVFEVDENGAEGAAVTSATCTVLSDCGPPPIIRVDHPFLFYVVDSALKAVLFAGRVDCP